LDLAGDAMILDRVIQTAGYGPYVLGEPLS
jgi:hypothetical protein